MDNRTLTLIIYSVYLLLLSIITFIAYGLDKYKAKKKKWRISEKALLLMSFFGGAFGGFLGMHLFRHKTHAEHWYFTAINIVGIILHASLLICIGFVFKF